MDKNEFIEKLITFNLLRNEPDNENKIRIFLSNNKKRYDHLMEKLAKSENFIKTFLENEEKNFLNNINYQKMKINTNNIGNALKDIENFFENSIQYNLYKDYFQVIKSKFFMALYSKNKKENIQSQKSLFNKTLKDYIILEILINFNEELNINNIPFKDIIIKEIKRIIENCKNIKSNKEQICLNEIRYELNTINEISIILTKSNNNIKKSFDNNYTKERNLIYLSYFENIKNVIQSLILLIDLFKVNKTKFYYNIINIKNIIENNVNVTLKNIKDYIQYLKSLDGFAIDITFFDKNDDNSAFVEFLNILADNEEGIKFGMGKINNEIRSLSEFVGESENSKLQINDIQDFMNVCNFFEAMKALKVQNDLDFIYKFKNAVIPFTNSFNNYLNNFKEIKNVYEEFLDKPEVSRIKIEQILKFSQIEIYFDNESRSIQIKGAYKDIYNQNKNFDFDDLEELHERALLFSSQSVDNLAKNVVENIEDKKKNSENFVRIVENIKQLKNYLLSLHIKGYPNILKIIIQIENGIALNEGIFY